MTDQPHDEQPRDPWAAPRPEPATDPFGSPSPVEHTQPMAPQHPAGQLPPWQVPGQPGAQGATTMQIGRAHV